MIWLTREQCVDLDSPHCKLLMHKAPNRTETGSALVSARHFLGIMTGLVVFVLILAAINPSGWETLPYNLEFYDSIWAPEETARGVLEPNERRFLVIYENESSGMLTARYLTSDEAQSALRAGEHVEMRENPWFYRLESPRGVLEENGTKYAPIRYGEYVLPIGPDLLEDLAGKEVELFGKWHDIKVDQTSRTTFVFGSEFVPKKIREAKKD